MPPERRSIASPPRSPPRYASPLSGTRIPPVASPLSSHPHRYNSSPVSYRTRPQLMDDPQRKRLAQLQQVHEEFNRQRTLYQQQQQHTPQPQPRQQDQPSLHIHHHQHHHHRSQVRPYVPPTQRFPTSSADNTSTTPTAADLTPSSIPSTPHYPVRSNQFSEWSVIKEKEQARLQSRMASRTSTFHTHISLPSSNYLINNDTKIHPPGSSSASSSFSPPSSSSSSSSSSPPSSSSSSSSSSSPSTIAYYSIQPPPVMSPQALARENLRQLSQRIQRRRARARETILYDLHQGVKSVEAQVHKQVEMVLSRLKEAPGSRYAFALTNSFLAQIPATLSNSLLPSAISAVADSVASQTNRSLTTMRGDMDEDDSESDEPQNGEGEEENDFYGESINHSHSKRIAHRRRRSRMSPPSPPRTFGRPVHDDEDSTSSLSPSHVMPHHHYHHHHQSDPLQMSLSSSGASEILAASQYHSFSNACSQVLNAALPSFLPSMVAPLVCVFSYPSPTASSSAPENPIHPLDTTSSSSSSSSRPNSEAKKEKDFVFPWGVPGAPSSSPAPPKPPSSSLPDPGIVVLNSKAWTTAEREALYLAATRFRLRGQWAKIREHMNLHRTDDEIAAEYQRLYGFNEDASRHGGQDDEMASADDEDEEDQEDNPAIGTPASPSSLSSDVADDADDEAEATPTVFMKFGGSHASARRQLQSRITHHGYPQHHLSPSSSSSSSYPTMSSCTIPSVSGSSSSGESTAAEMAEEVAHATGVFVPMSKGPLRLIRKEVMINKRFALEEIPLHI